MDYSQTRRRLERQLEQLTSERFEALSLDIFRFQARYNPVYRSFLSLLGRTPDQVKRLADIPFLPISLFKSHVIKTGDWPEETTFTSSGTTGQTTSRHYVRSLDFYVENTVRCFASYYGPLEDYCVYALLPAYLERRGSSLVYMARHFIERDGCANGGFFLHNLEELANQLRKSQKSDKSPILLGVSFALWDLAEQYPQDLSHCIIMETGGMKGRRKEITRPQLHQILKAAFGVEAIHSEYGMTELLSQAYSKGEGLYQPAPTMRVRTREITDPLTPQVPGKTGAVNIIDLANLDTISFIAAEDLGKAYPDGSFEILGRLDASDLRGCNLMVEDLQLR